MNTERPPCDLCGQPANVHISDILAGEQVTRRFCPDCADLIPDKDSAQPVRRSAQAAVLLVVGGLILFISLLADVLQFGGSQGFGIQQQVGVLLGAIMLLLGAVTRTPTLLVIGVISAGLAFLADWLAFGSSGGFGWQQAGGSVTGAALMAFGMYLVRPAAPT